MVLAGTDLPPPRAQQSEIYFRRCSPPFLSPLNPKAFISGDGYWVRGCMRCCCCCCCFSHSAHWLPTRKKLLYTVANPARGMLNREKKKKKKSLAAPLPPPPPTRALLVGENRNKKSRYMVGIALTVWCVVL